MRKYLVLLTVCICILFSNAQNVGIGTPNPQNKLHVGGGFRLDTLTGVGGAGLVRHDANGAVYGIKFSGNATDVLRGDGSFGALNISGAVGWLLNGNSGTNPASNFLGTTDNQPLVFRVNNVRHGYLSNSSIFLGSNAGQFNTANGNIGIGSGTLGKNTNKGRMVAIGDSALYNNGTSQDAASSSENVAIGYRALYSNINGGGNTAIGTNALEKSDGYYNVAVGYAAMYSSTTGGSNSAIGVWALFNNTSGSSNCAFGRNALLNNTTGSQNIAIGQSSLQGNSIGIYNTAVGYASLASNNANENSALGYRALVTNSIGTFNCAFGSYALENSNAGNLNSAFGKDALRNNIASLNSAFGARALHINTLGIGNTAVGHLALSNNISGSENTAVGRFAGGNLPNNVSNVTVIGANTGWLTTSSNQVNIGNFSVSWIGGQTGWFHYSDKRIKNDIKDDVPGLSFISRLKPITYHIDIRKQEEIANGGKIETTPELIKTAQKEWKGKYDVEKIKMTGFFAQDVEEAAKAINYSFNGVHNPKNGGLLSLDYSAFVVPLVKAVQEQQKLIEDQHKKIDNQQQQINVLIKEIQSLRKDLITEKN